MAVLAIIFGSGSRLSFSINSCSLNTCICFWITKSEIVLVLNISRKYNSFTFTFSDACLSYSLIIFLIDKSEDNFNNKFFYCYILTVDKVGLVAKPDFLFISVFHIKYLHLNGLRKSTICT